MFAVDPVRRCGDVRRRRWKRGSTYRRRIWRLAPISSILDTLTLLTVGQHIALLLWAIGAFVLWRVLRARRHTVTIGVKPSPRSDCCSSSF